MTFLGRKVRRQCCDIGTIQVDIGCGICDNQGHCKPGQVSGVDTAATDWPVVYGILHVARGETRVGGTDSVTSTYQRHQYIQFRYRIKPDELYILSFEKGRGQKPSPFSKLRM